MSAMFANKQERMVIYRKLVVLFDENLYKHRIEGYYLDGAIVGTGKRKFIAGLDETGRFFVDKKREDLYLY